jgi:hypothetical protein
MWSVSTAPLAERIGPMAGPILTRKTQPTDNWLYVLLRRSALQAFFFFINRIANSFAFQMTFFFKGSCLNSNH